MIGRRHGFTVVEAVLAGVVVAALLALVLVVVFANGRRTVRGPCGFNSQIRGIHQSMFTYAQSNRDYFPGLSSKGRIELPDDVPDNGFIDGVGGEAVTFRFAEMLTNDFFTGEYAASPLDDRTVWQGIEEDGDVTLAHLSFALPDLTEGGQRLATWRGDLAADWVAVSDRNAGPERGERLATIHPPAGKPEGAPEPGAWRGEVAWMDNHVSFEESATMVVEGAADALFERAGGDDAWQVFE